MPRDLLLHPVIAEFEPSRTCAALATTAVESLQLGADDSVSSSLRAIRRLKETSIAEPYRCVHAWGVRALSIAAISTRSPLLFSPIRWPSNGDLRMLRAVMSAKRDVHVACPTETMRRLFLKRGVPIGQCHVVRPSVDSSSLKTRRDNELRRALGILPDDHILLTPGDSTRAANHSLALFAATILNVMNRSNRMLISGEGNYADTLRRFAKRLQQPTLVDARLLLDRKAPFETLLSAADEVLVTSTETADTLPIAQCMAAGLPIVATVNSTTAELLEDRHNALLVANASARRLAAKVLDLRDNPNMQWQICDRAKADAYEFFSPSRMREEFAALYMQIGARGGVVLPQRAAGAGSRFVGRA